MEPNGLPGGMYSSMGTGMLGLEMSLHHHHPQHQTHQNPHLSQQNPRPQMVAFSHHESDHATQPMKQPPYPQPPKSKPQLLTLSDEDEPAGEDSGGADGKKKASPWQRMKWTDSMVRLLIMVVFYIGDEGGPEGGPADPGGKKKCSGGVLQKKGKWKSVSRALMDRGFCVSPQQCEDKFNDLNKRYKRVNDILGKGTACKVVENQKLLDTMDQLSPKMKEEVKKLLNSKHLFFREMCAYHNSCGGGTGGGASGGNGVPAAPHSSELDAERSQVQQQQQQQMCLHGPHNPPVLPNPSIMGMERYKIAKESHNEDCDNEDEDDEDEDDDDDELGYANGGSGMRSNENGHEDDEGSDGKCSRKRQRKGLGASNSPLIQQLSSDLVNVAEDVTRTYMEKRQWIKNRLIKLEEEQVNYQLEAYELEKQRLKWLKFSTKKEREMEREKLKNERVKLENERMLLMLRKKEFELLCRSVQLQQSQIPPN